MYRYKIIRLQTGFCLRTFGQVILECRWCNPLSSQGTLLRVEWGFWVLRSGFVGEVRWGCAEAEFWKGGEWGLSVIGWNKRFLMWRVVFRELLGLGREAKALWGFKEEIRVAGIACSYSGRQALF